MSWNGSDYAWVSNAGYTDSDVDTHLNQSNPTSGYVLSWNGSDYAWVEQSVGVTTENVVADSLVVSGVSTLGVTTISQLSVSGISTFAIGGGSTVFFGGESGEASLAISHAAGASHSMYMQFTSHDGDVASIETDSNSNMTITGGSNINLKSDSSHTVLSSGGNATQIYYDNTLKLATSNEGVSITGDAQLSGSVISSYTGSTETYTVTTGSKSAAHRYPSGGGSSTNAYFIDGVEAPFLTLTPGKTYRFTNDNTGSHPLKFYLRADKSGGEYTTGVNYQNTYTELTVTDETPTVLHYQCTAHGYMGNAVQVNSNKVNTPYQIDGLSGANITGVVTATSFSGTSASFSGNVSVGGTLTYEDVTNIDSVGLITARSGIHFGLAGVGGSVTSAGNATFVGVATAASFVKSGGTSAQYLMADGSTTEGDSLTKGYIAGLTAFLN